jgi:SAM-dependent methyltransferase
VQAYGEEFARIYNLKWSAFTKQVAPFLLRFYSSTPEGSKQRPVLDLCCGAGHLAMHFLEEGYRVVGIDLSEHMLRYAKEKTAQFIDSGRIEFRKADASDFMLSERFGLVLSVYDSLNHLANEKDLISCFQCVYAVCDGYFIFDLNTRFGLRRWNSIQVDESSEDALLISRGIYDGQSDRASMRITGFVEATDGVFRRFDETIYNTVFDLQRVKEALLDIGWKYVYFARVRDLPTEIAEPEKEGRVFIVAAKH